MYVYIYISRIPYKWVHYTYPALLEIATRWPGVLRSRPLKTWKRGGLPFTIATITRRTSNLVESIQIFGGRKKYFLSAYIFPPPPPHTYTRACARSITNSLIVYQLHYNVVLTYCCYKRTIGKEQKTDLVKSNEREDFDEQTTLKVFKVLLAGNPKGLISP